MRTTAETLRLDLSLRQSRMIYASLAAIFLPIAVSGLIWGQAGLVALGDAMSGMAPQGDLLVAFGAVLLAVISVGAEYVMIAQCVEASRRLATLREHPERVVRELRAPFQSSLFGPYH